MAQPLLNGEVEYVEDRGADRVELLENRLSSLEASLSRVKRDAVVALLQVLADSIRHIASGKMDIPDISSEPSDGKWEAVKSRLQPSHRKVIDVLLLQGAMTRKQISAAVQMNYTNCVNNVIGPLIRQGWLVDNGRDISLKEL